MKDTSDQVRAQRLLALRERGPYRFSTFLRLNASRYLVRIVLNVVGLTIIAFTGMWLWLAFFAGIIVGGFLRDASWVRSTRRMWPFTMKVTNWALVEELAAAQAPPPAVTFSQND